MRGGRKNCDIEVTDEFKSWWNRLTAREQDDVTRVVEALEEHGTDLPKQYSSGILTSKYGHMRELRLRSGGQPIRIFYAFDPRRTAILLIGGRKTHPERFYEEYVPRADAIYDQYLRELRRERLIEREREGESR
ncbi:MAG: type II toxin-antitoxin system RelE/ParE family toxin [Acidobacteria bacterium]|nr:type II toxin-antitoxin system RelE/ParE family toxin [Acidobacteriota bacterium]